MNRKPEIFWQEIIVDADNLDASGHVNNVVYLQWVQNIAEAHWQLRAPEDLKMYRWVALNHFIEYKKPAFLGDVVTIRTFIGKTVGVRCERFVEFYKKDESLLAKVRSEWCMVDGEKFRPIRLPHDLFQRFMTDENS